VTTTKRLYGPAYISNAAGTNIYQGGVSGADPAVHDVLTHIHVDNVTNAAVTFNMYIGVTGGHAGGTQLFATQNVPAYSPFDYYCRLMLASTDFLSGDASSASALVVTIEGYQEVP